MWWKEIRKMIGIMEGRMQVRQNRINPHPFTPEKAERSKI